MISFFKRKTFCPRLWEEAFIDPKGNVFTCCHHQPAVLGNIYQETLENIFNNEILRSFRKKSLEGRLECFEQCTLLDKQNISPQKRTADGNYQYLERLKITVGRACNINCIMCRQNHHEKLRLDYEKFVENVNIDSLTDIELQGGELLLLPEINRFLEFFASKTKKVSLLTNGLLINNKWAEWIALHSDWVHISINAATKKTHELINKGSRWEAVLENIQKIVAARLKHHSSVKIIGHMTIVPQNVREIPAFIKNYNQWGFDRINFGYDRGMPRYLKYKLFLKMKIRSEIKRAMNQSDDPVAIDALRLRMLKLIS